MLDKSLVALAVVLLVGALAWWPAHALERFIEPGVASSSDTLVSEAMHASGRSVQAGSSGSEGLPTECARSTNAPLINISEHEGFALVQVNSYGDLLIVLGLTDSGSESGALRARHLYRIAPLGSSASAASAFVDAFSEGVVPVETLEFGTVDLHEVRVQDLSGQGVTWRIRLDKSGCGLSPRGNSEDDGHVRIEARAIGQVKFSRDEYSVEAAALEFYDRPVIVRDDTHESAAGDDGVQAFYCVAGGPGAVACSWDSGTIGPIGGGGCSVECMVPYFYACCGPGLPNCECRPYNGNGGGDGIGYPLPPPEDPCDIDPDCGGGSDDPHGST